MTKRRSDIERSLAERGHFGMWANEQEAAVLSRVGMDVFRRKVGEWEMRGFPRIHPDNGMRSIPGIYAFFGLPLGLWNSRTPPATPLVDDDEDGQENF